MGTIGAVAFDAPNGMAGVLLAWLRKGGAAQGDLFARKGREVLQLVLSVFLFPSSRVRRLTHVVTLAWLCPQVIDSSSEGTPADLVTGVVRASWAARGTGWSVRCTPLFPLAQHLLPQCRLNGARGIPLGEEELAADIKSLVCDVPSLHYASLSRFPTARLPLAKRRSGDLPYLLHSFIFHIIHV
eukprot:gene12075-biopygen19926